MKVFTESNIKNASEALKAYADEINSLPEMKWEEADEKASALILVDIVNGFVREGAMASPDVESIIKPASKLLEKCKKANIPIAAFADCHKKGCAEFNYFPEHCLENTSESELVDELKNIGGYTLIPKNSTNGFHEEAFKSFLKNNAHVKNFIVVGDCTDICVLQFCITLKTWFNAQNIIADITVPADSVETYDAPYHNGAFANIAAYKLMRDCGIKFVKTIG